MSGQSRLTMVGLTVVGLAVVLIVLMRGAFVPAGLLFAGIPLVAAALVGTRITWMPALAALVALVYMLEGVQGRPAWAGMTSEPTEVLSFMWLDAARFVQTVGSAVATLAGIAATIGNYRRSERSA